MLNKLPGGILKALLPSQPSRTDAIAPEDRQSVPAGGILRYMVQLDALRALAVFAVMIHHFLPRETWLRMALPWGSLGVRLFFVLSGFLITGILLKCRDLIQVEKQDAWFTVRNFYARRFLRILPIYYLALLVAAAINIKPIRESLLWHLTYASNLYIAFTGHWLGPLSHLWSLSIEEQFYLVWPWLILFLPQRHLLKAIVLTIAIAPLFRLLSIGNFLDETQVYVFPLASLDALGLGALLAFYHSRPEQFGSAKRLLGNIGLWVCAPAFIMLRLLHVNVESAGVGVAIAPFLMALFFFWLVARTAQGFGGITGKLLELQPLVYIGKISYGLYLYHALIQGVLPAVCDRLRLPYPDSILSRFILLTLISFIVATASWYWVEKPINNFKHHFEYKQKQV